MTALDTVKLLITLFGGIGLFLYGMTIMANSLEKLAGSKLERIVEKMTGNIFSGVLCGAVVAALIHSSGATTVIVVGFVNSGIMKLGQAVGVIMGANIGTTVTAQILRLTNIGGGGWSELFGTAILSSVFVIIGAVLYMFCKRAGKRTVGQILIGLGILFFSMNAMSTAVSPLAESEAFKDIFVKFENPFFGVLVGAGVTALLQSSTASVGILQALTVTGVVKFSIAAPIIFGQNIGTCIVALISSIGATKNAKRAAMIHFYFNLIGTVVFLVLLYLAQAIVGLPFWNSTMTYGSIADLHLIFNLGCTALFLPFNKVLVFLAEKTIRGGEEKNPEENIMLDTRFLQTPSIAIDKARECAIKMANLAHENYHRAIKLLDQFSSKELENLAETEHTIDHLESQLDNYMIQLTRRGLTPDENFSVSDILRAIGDFERIGDYVENIADVAVMLNDRGEKFTDEAKREMSVIFTACDEILEKAIACYSSRDGDMALEIEPLEQVIDLIQERMKAGHINRLKEERCTVEMGIAFSDLLTYLERISDHASNVAVYIIQYSVDNRDRPDFDAHEYLQQVHKGTTNIYKENYNMYKEKYLSCIK